MMAGSRKARNSYSGFAKRLDAPEYDLAVQRSQDAKNDHSSVAGAITAEIVENSRNRAFIHKPHFSIGTRVRFRLDIDHRWKRADYFTGRIIQRFFKTRWFYVITDDNGRRYSLPFEKIKSLDIAIWQQPIYEMSKPVEKNVTPVAVGELAA